MRIRAFGAASLVAGLLLAVGIPSDGWAQGITGKIGSFSGAAEIGARGFTAEPTALERGKFEEYKDVRAGAVLERLLLSYTPSDSFGTYELSARRLLRRDQSAWLRASRPGLYDLNVRWDGIPHTFTTVARSPGEELTPGYNTLPTPRPDSMAWRNSPYIGAIRSQWNPIRTSLAVTPTPELDLTAEYRWIGKTGGRPNGLSYSASSGPQREFREPIDHMMHDIRVAHSYANDRFSLGGSYAFSIFQNNQKSVTVDNPAFATDQPRTSITQTALSARGLVALAPDNTAHTASVTGAVNLPARTRVSATATYSLWKQNDAFFPQTTNSTLVSSPLLALERSSLEGQATTTTMNLGLNSRPTKNLSVTARFRVYDYSNQTPHFQLRGMAISDRSIEPGDSLPFEPHPFTKSNTDVSGRYRLPNGFAVSAGYGMENWKRDAHLRNVAKTDEGTSRVALDYTGNRWLTLHGSYTMGSRSGGAYKQAATELANFRRFDLSDRDRTRVNFGATVMPSDSISLSFSYQSGNDKYPNSQYGTQRDDSRMYGADLDWMPTRRLSLGLGYTIEIMENDLNSRFRTGAVGSATYDNATYRFVTTDRGKSTTTYASFAAVVVPDKLDVGGNLSVYDSRFQLLNRNPSTPTGGTTAQNLLAKGEDWPEVSTKMTPISVFLRWKYESNWAVTLRYQMETYDPDDFRFRAPSWSGLTGDLPTAIVVGPTGSPQTGTFHFLGNGFRSYNASYLTFLVSYRPSALPFGRGRSAL